jgi:hypothetical protein
MAEGAELNGEHGEAGDKQYRHNPGCAGAARRWELHWYDSWV